MTDEPTFAPGDLVLKHSGDYAEIGEVRTVFAKIDGKVRYIVEHPTLLGRGTILHIYSASNLRLVCRADECARLWTHAGLHATLEQLDVPAVSRSAVGRFIADWVLRAKMAMTAETQE